MASTNPYLNTYLGVALKEQWAAYCGRLGKKPGAALREAIQAQLVKGQGGKTKQPASKKQKPESPDDGAKIRLELRLTPSERAAVEAFAQAGECSAQQWVVSAIRGVVTKAPQFTMEEWKALGESNYQLLSIGRNLNQIARHLNEQAKGRNSVVIDEKSLAEIVVALQQGIKRHVSQVSKSLRANIERWTIE